MLMTWGLAGERASGTADPEARV